jgi:TetR/AcrR family transcriptional regulator, regulator of cefoperazone and chloramphenicol sensitivity
MADADLTKARLLEAAGEEFAEKGFEAARIRSICDRAGANLAAVNYHFGDKEQLYIATVLHAHRCGVNLVPESVFEEGTPVEQLRGYIRHFLSSVIGADQHRGWHHALMLHEMLQPTPALEILVREAIRPRFERLKGIMRQVCPEAEEPRLNALVFSVVGQCIHYKVCRPIAERLIGAKAFESMDVNFVSDHISAFCLAALGLTPPLNAAGESPTADALPALGRGGS